MINGIPFIDILLTLAVIAGAVGLLIHLFSGKRSR
jgi:hypothetical protein